VDPEEPVETQAELAAADATSEAEEVVEAEDDVKSTVPAHLQDTVSTVHPQLLLPLPGAPGCHGTISGTNHWWSSRCRWCRERLRRSPQKSLPRKTRLRRKYALSTFIFFFSAKAALHLFFAKALNKSSHYTERSSSTSCYHQFGTW